MRNDRDLQAPWVGQSDWDYLGWETEKEEEKDIAYWEKVDRLIDEKKEEEWFREKENENAE